jgi:hypothetical protein
LPYLGTLAGAVQHQELSTPFFVKNLGHLRDDVLLGLAEDSGATMADSNADPFAQPLALLDVELTL